MDWSISATSLEEQKTSANAFADWWKRFFRSRCCREFWFYAWFATSQSKTKVMEANDEAGAFESRGGIQILGTGISLLAWPRSVGLVCLRPGRDQFDECACSLSEISSFSSSTACR